MPNSFSKKQCREISFLTFIMVSLSLLVTIKVVDAKVYIPRGDRLDPFESPQSFDAKKIYSGRFKINGVSTEMHVLSSQETPRETAARLERIDQNHVYLQKSTNDQNILGIWRNDHLEKQFLISPAGNKNGCLIFVLEGQTASFSTKNIEWPSMLPQLDPVQENQLVVEHLDTHFIFASTILFNLSLERVLNMCAEQMMNDGWELMPAGQDTSSQRGKSGTRLLIKKGEACWIHARTSPERNQLLITFSCNKA